VPDGEGDAQIVVSVGTIDSPPYYGQYYKINCTDNFYSPIFFFVALGACAILFSIAGFLIGLRFSDKNKHHYAPINEDENSNENDEPIKN